MPDTLKKLIISGPLKDNSGLCDHSYEVEKLMTSGREYYESVTYLNPLDVFHIIDPKKKKTEIYYKGKNISDSTSLIVRSTYNCEEATRLFALSLYANNCELLDPLERFNGSPAGKSVMALKGLKEKTSPLTFIAYSNSAALELTDIFRDKSLYPLIAKPSTGKQGKDLMLLENEQKALEYIESFFTFYAGTQTGLIFQKQIQIKYEYRVMLLDGKSLGMVEKLPCSTSVARNAAQGSEFIFAHDPEVEEFAINHSSKKGLIGVDIAVDLDDRYFLIESNRSPQWKYFELVTGVDVAQEIMKLLERRLMATSELFGV